MCALLHFKPRYQRLQQWMCTSFEGTSAQLGDVCSTRLINGGPTMLGEKGVVVQIDELLFVHKCKVSREMIVLGGVMTNYGYSNNKGTLSGIYTEI